MRPHGSPRRSGWRYSTEHHLSWSTESSAAACAPHGGVGSRTGRRSDSASSAAANRRCNSKACTDTTIAPRTIRYPQHYRVARDLTGMGAHVYQHRASGVLPGFAACRVPHPSLDLSSRGGSGRNTDQAPNSRNSPMRHEVRYLDQYLTQYQAAGCARHHDGYLLHRPSAHGLNRLAADTGQRLANHPARWQQTTSTRTCHNNCGRDVARRCLQNSFRYRRVATLHDSASRTVGDRHPHARPYRGPAVRHHRVGSTSHRASARAQIHCGETCPGRGSHYRAPCLSPHLALHNVLCHQPRWDADPPRRAA